MEVQTGHEYVISRVHDPIFAQLNPYEVSVEVDHSAPVTPFIPGRVYPSKSNMTYVFAVEAHFRRSSPGRIMLTSASPQDDNLPGGRGSVYRPGLPNSGPSSASLPSQVPHKLNCLTAWVQDGLLLC